MIKLNDHGIIYLIAIEIIRIICQIILVNGNNTRKILVGILIYLQYQFKFLTFYEALTH